MNSDSDKISMLVVVPAGAEGGSYARGFTSGLRMFPTFVKSAEVLPSIPKMLRKDLPKEVEFLDGGVCAIKHVCTVHDHPDIKIMAVEVVLTDTASPADVGIGAHGFIGENLPEA